MYPRTDTALEIARLRTREARDTARRLAVISPRNLRLNHPLERPVTAFNAAMFVEGDRVHLYPRVILGYYLYVSSIARVEIPLDELLNGIASRKVYGAELIVNPSSRYDLWGCEDPRVTRLGDYYVMVYTGRTINYFDVHIRRERTLPVAAVSRDGVAWGKAAAFVHPDQLRYHLVSDKDAFIVSSGGVSYVFHRPHTDDERFHLAISRAPAMESVLESPPEPGAATPREVTLVDTVVVMEPAPWEQKLGWSTPPVEVGGGEHLVLIHSVDRETQVYRAFAALVKLDGTPRVTAVTRYYVLEPREIWERVGDRPLCVFPCGAAKVDDKLLVSYGAADSVVGIAALDLSELLEELDRNRIE